MDTTTYRCMAWAGADSLALRITDDRAVVAGWISRRVADPRATRITILCRGARLVSMRRMATGDWITTTGRVAGIPTATEYREGAPPSTFTRGMPFTSAVNGRYNGQNRKFGQRQLADGTWVQHVEVYCAATDIWVRAVGLDEMNRVCREHMGENAQCTCS